MAMVPMQDVRRFADSAPLLEQPAELRRRAAEDGYLFLRGLLPEQDVLAMRTLVLAHCEGARWLDADAPLAEGRVRPGLIPRYEGDGGEWAAFYKLLYTRREIHAFNQHPRLLAAAQALLGAAVMAQPRWIVRTMFPGSAAFTTPPHQDVFYIGGTHETWTAWIPLGDCPEELGSLVVAAGSHKRGPLPVHKALGAGGHAVDAASDLDWVGGALAAGDVLLFHSCTIHQARDNISGDRLRLSCDFRYQAIDQPVGQNSLRPHAMWPKDHSWERVYAGWDPADPLRYFWRRLPLVPAG